MLLNKKTKYLFLIFLIVASFSCLTLFKISKEYIPDNKLVYLKQPYYLTPIKYFPEKTSLYKWDTDINIDSKNPGILSLTDFNKLLALDLKQDIKIYKEVKEHLLLMKDDSAYKELRDELNNYKAQKPLPRKIIKGDKINDYSNAIEYAYPEEAGALISIFKNNEIIITFSDKRKYFYKSNGSYYEEDAKGNELYAVFPDQNSYRIKSDNFSYFQYADENKIINEKGELIKFFKPTPQYSFKPAKKSYKYIFFVDDFVNENIESIALIHDNLLRYDYVFDKDAIMINNKEIDALVITSDYIKTYHYFNPKTRKAEDIYSYYFPEGIQIKDVNKQLSYSLVHPKWPENYLEKKIGPFKFLYTKKDEQLINKINIQKLNEINSFIRKIIGINFAEERSIVLPPDIESYRKLHAEDHEETLKWYPSGFETKDIIIMWPPSVKRYEGEQGDKYFWEKEFYEILIHDLTNLIIGEITGVVSEVPVWLNEGLALYVECDYSEESKKYWNIVFNASEYNKKILSWDEAAINSSSEYSLDLARTQYSQSYKMVTYLIKKYDMNSIINYIKSFKIQTNKIIKTDIKSSYKENFKKIFNTNWEENLIIFDKYIKEEKK